MTTKPPITNIEFIYPTIKARISDQKKVEAILGRIAPNLSIIVGHIILSDIHFSSIPTGMDILASTLYVPTDDVTFNRLVKVTKGGILNFRGSITYSGSLICFPIYLTHNPQYSLVLWMDMKKLVAIAIGTKEQDEFIETVYDIYPTKQTILNYLDQLVEDKFPVSIDIETARGKISRIGLTNSTSYAMSIPFFHIQNYMSFENDWVWPYLRNWFREVEVIGQNFGSYDTIWLYEPPYNCQRINLVYDTMVAQHVILPGLPDELKPHSLEFLTSIYLSVPYYKDEVKHQEGKAPQDHVYGEYNCKDVIYPIAIRERQMIQRTFKQQEHIFQEEMDLLNTTLKRLMITGVKFDEPYLAKLKSRASLEANYLAPKFCSLINDTLNLGSSAQIQALFYSKKERDKNEIVKNGTKAKEKALYAGCLNLHPQFKAGTKKHKGKKILTSDYSALVSLCHAYAGDKKISSILSLLRKYRKVTKASSNILSVVLRAGRNHSMYRQATSTGRLNTSADPWRTGVGIHTVPRSKTFRRLGIPDPPPHLWIPSEEVVWISTDLSQAEAWATYYFAEADHVLEYMRNGKKPHQMMASNISHRPYEEVGKGTDEYALGKKSVHSSHYMIGPEAFAKGCKTELELIISVKQARAILELYYSKVPEIRKNFHHKVFNLLHRDNKILTNPWGRSRKFHYPLYPEFKKSIEILQKAVAFLPQSTIGELMNKIAKRWDNKIRSVGWGLCVNHDELNVGCYVKNLDQCRKEIDMAFEYPFTIGRYEDVIIPWDMTIGKNWAGDKLNV